MNIKAIFPEGVTALTVNGLHQWDYGRKLEIHADGLPSIVEVHFACPGMDEAVVRACDVVNGVVEAAIPDRCLEQTAPVTAWLFEISGSTGLTTKSVTLPVTPRAKPQPGSTIPEAYTDRYTELITAVNDTVTKLGNGEINVPYAVKAGQADTAGEATKATQDGNGNDIAATYMTKKTLSDALKLTVESKTTTFSSGATQITPSLKVTPAKATPIFYKSIKSSATGNGYTITLPNLADALDAGSIDITIKASKFNTGDKVSVTVTDIFEQEYTGTLTLLVSY